MTVNMLLSSNRPSVLEGLSARPEVSAVWNDPNQGNEMIRIPFPGLAIEPPENSGGVRVPAPIRTPKQLAGRADSPRKPISA